MQNNQGEQRDTCGGVEPAIEKDERSRIIEIQAARQVLNTIGRMKTIKIDFEGEESPCFPSFDFAIRKMREHIDKSVVQTERLLVLLRDHINHLPPQAAIRYGMRLQKMGIDADQLQRTPDWDSIETNGSNIQEKHRDLEAARATA